jgi:hypothetical protein
MEIKVVKDKEPVYDLNLEDLGRCAQEMLLKLIHRLPLHSRGQQDACCDDPGPPRVFLGISQEP